MSMSRTKRSLFLLAAAAAFAAGQGGSSGTRTPSVSRDIGTPTALPAAGITKTYTKGGKLCSLDPAGNENCTGASGFSATANLGDPAIDGSWRLTVSGNNLLIQRRESGAWATKSTIVP
jgi:hypothetical protein